MSFKILAIRPIDGINPNLLKRLNVNFIYRFYQEYDFNYSSDKETFSYIDKQKRVLNPEVNLLKFEEITSIIYNKQIPDHFFGKNINVSSIVGKNGDGKSSILELLYYSVYKFATYVELVERKVDNRSNLNLELEIYLQRGMKIIKYTFSKNEIFITESDLSQSNLYNLDKKSNQRITRDHLYYFYSIVLNYSVYGLNSSVSGNWLDSLFHKNDGYKTPIVINPYRDEGNLDINNEYLLAQSRLLLNYYVINNQILHKDIHVSRVQFILNVQKQQSVTLFDKDKDEFFQQNLNIIYKYLINNKYFFKIVSHILNYNFCNHLVLDFIKEMFIDNGKIIYRDGFCYLNSDGEIQEIDKKWIEFTGSRIDIENIGLKILNCLYVFKKIYKISNNYKEYSFFKILFNDEKTDLNKEEINLNELRDVTIMIIHTFLQKRINLFLFSKEGISLNQFIENIELQKELQKELQASMEFFFSPYIADSILHTIIVNIVSNVFTKYKVKTSSIINLVSNVVNFYFNQIFPSSNVSVQVKYIDKDSSGILSLLLLQLYSDDSHITFKLKQAINYYNQGFFNNIKAITKDEKENDLIIDINQEYLQSRNINTIPLAFVQPIIMVTKRENDKDSLNNSEFSFNQLSSGEQQLIHSLLTVVYHVYNIKSISTSEKETYENINIIFDEIELYFHPDYQRTYIYSLILLLNHINKDNKFYFNILLSTHSPFILSDIPSQNILKIRKGIPVENGDINSFSANIHDLLADDFFLEDGFMGEFAKSKINDLVEFLSNKKPNKTIYNWNEDNILDFIELIGEPLIKNSLKDLYKRYKGKSYDELLKFYEEYNAKDRQ